MGMSTSITGIKPADEKWTQMKAIWDACELANIDVPNEVGNFFDWEEPSELGVKVALKENHGVVELPGESGYQVDLKMLPKDIRYLKFENSW
jgi:hypothetical protein